MPEDLRYPIGRFKAPGAATATQRVHWIDEIAVAPMQLRASVDGLTGEQLDTPYRPGGWTVRQVVHHVPDSHINSYVRFRWALTEQTPLIKAYEEGAWAELHDDRTAPVEPSLALLDVLHARWILLLRSLTEADYARTLRHPVVGEVSLTWMLAQYAWHGRHHVAHITALRQRKGWG